MNHIGSLQSVFMPSSFLWCYFPGVAHTSTGLQERLAVEQGAYYAHYLTNRIQEAADNADHKQQQQDQGQVQQVEKGAE